ncbi:MAG: hypothetical protein IH820_07145, partial [Bacteroidetes bacterium]|nr:hypothetical protein [Bacteroidota bacterium]
MTEVNAQITDAFSGHAEVHEPSESFRARAHVKSMDEYRAMYRRSIEDPEGFWGEQAQRLTWFEPYHTVKNVS